MGVTAYQDDRAQTAFDLSGSITVGYGTEETNSDNSVAWGFSNFRNEKNGLNNVLGQGAESTRFNAVTGVKCYTATAKKTGKSRTNCEFGVSSDYYPTIRSKSQATITIDGVSLTFEVAKTFPDGYNNAISIGGEKQGNVMFYTYYNAKETDFFKLLSNSVGKTLTYKIAWQ